MFIIVLALLFAETTLSKLLKNQPYSDEWYIYPLFLPFTAAGNLTLHTILEFGVTSIVQTT